MFYWHCRAVMIILMGSKQLSFQLYPHMKSIYTIASILFFTIVSHAQNVGVGTSTPNQKLEVAGWIELGNQTEGVTGTEGSIRYHSVSKVIQYFDGTTWVDLLPASAAGDDDWLFSGVNLYNGNTGNVGIGTTSFTEKVNIGGDLRVLGSGSTIGLTNVANGAIIVDNTLGIDGNEIMFDIQANIGTVGAQDVVFHTNGGAKMTLAANGNFGIGITPPQQKLHVAGNARISGIASGANGAIVRTNTSGDLLVTNLTGSTSDVLLGNGTFGTPTGLGDNLGNHTATANLNMNTREIDNVVYTDFGQVEGYGVRFWSSDNYKISMGNSTEYKYGPVTDYSIKTNMNSTTGRGWTWGILGATPIAGLNNTGDMQINGDFTVIGADINVGSSGEKIYVTGDDLRLSSNSGYIDIIPADGTHGIILRDYTGASSDWTGMRHVNNGSLDRMEFSVANGGYGSGLVLRQDNRVGIGVTAPGYSLHVAGKIKSDGVTETSDIRLKKNIQPISNALEKLLLLNGVTYNWRVNEFPQFKLSEGMELGVIAQDIQKIFPEVVNTDDEGYLSVEYSHLVPVLIEAIKAQQLIIDEYKAKLDGTSDLLNALQAQLDLLQQDMNTIKTNGTITTK